MKKVLRYRRSIHVKPATERQLRSKPLWQSDIALRMLFLARGRRPWKMLVLFLRMIRMIWMMCVVLRVLIRGLI